MPISGYEFKNCIAWNMSREMDYGTMCNALQGKMKKSSHGRNPEWNRDNESAEVPWVAQYANKHMFPGQSLGTSLPKV